MFFLDLRLQSVCFALMLCALKDSQTRKICLRADFRTWHYEHADFQNMRSSQQRQQNRRKMISLF
jgi:hypothetical protein